MRKRLVIASVAIWLSFLPRYGYGQSSNVMDLKGTDWVRMSYSNKVGYMTGFLSGVGDSLVVLYFFVADLGMFHLSVYTFSIVE